MTELEVVFGVLITIAILWGIIQLFNKYRSRKHYKLNQNKIIPNNVNALIVLRKRFADKEISKNEYERLKREIFLNPSTTN
jgi:uncharacterized membrane protein